MPCARNYLNGGNPARATCVRNHRAFFITDREDNHPMLIVNKSADA